MLSVRLSCSSLHATIIFRSAISVTFHGIYIVSPRDSFIVGVSMHLWATLCMTCSCSQGDLVPPVSRGRETRPLGGASLITQSVR